MRTLTKPGRPTLPPAQPTRPPAARTFVVRCTTCDRRFEVDRAPATCASCGGLAIAGRGGAAGIKPRAVTIEK